MALGLLDLSIVTKRLIAMLDKCITLTPSPESPLSVAVTGLRPDDPKNKDEAEYKLSLYLFHVIPDKFHTNTFPRGGPARAIPEQPLALTLYYLLSVYADDSNFASAQQVMSIALKCFHDNAIVIAQDSPEQLTLTIESHTVDEIGRLWQALACPLRMSAVYRVSVIFLEPEPPPPSSSKLVLRPHVDAHPFPSAQPPVVLSATVTTAGLATITATGFVGGAGLIPESMEMQIGGLVFALSTNPHSTEPGRFRVIDPTTIELRFPTGTPTVLKGKYLLRARLDRNQPAVDVVLEVP